MAIKIQNTQNFKVDAVKCVVYGQAGSGKTRLAASAPTPLMISAEAGLLSLAGTDVDFIEVTSLKQWDEVYRYVKSSGEAKKYETICLDSLSEIAEVLVSELKPNFKDARQAYGALADAMLPMLRKFRDLPGKHTVFTAKMITLQDEESGRVTDELMLPGKVLPSQVPYLVDELFYIGMNKKKQTVVQTAPDRRVFCKDRSGALDPEEEPNMTAIINKIMAKSKQK